MRSVSMSLPRTTMAGPATRSMREEWSCSGVGAWGWGCAPPPHVDHFARDRSRCHHRRAHQQRPSGRAALTSLEVAIRRRGAHLAAFELVRIHAEAHRAAGVTPVESRAAKNVVETFAFGGSAHGLRSRARRAPARAAPRGGPKRRAPPRADRTAARSCRSR